MTTRECTCCACHRPAAEPALGCPVRVYLGATDPTIDPAKAGAWAQESAGDYAVQVFPGGHFFAQESELIVLTRLQHDVRRLLSSVVPA